MMTSLSGLFRGLSQQARASSRGFDAEPGAGRQGIEALAAIHVADEEAAVRLEDRVLVLVRGHRRKGRAGMQARGEEEADADASRAE